MPEIVWDIVSPLQDESLQGEDTGGKFGVVLEEKPYRPMAMVSVKKGEMVKLSSGDVKKIGIKELDNQTIVKSSKNYTWVWFGFNQWLVLGQEGDDVYSSLIGCLRNCAVSQQHGSRVHICLRGEKSVNVLEKMALIDLDVSIFKVGDVAQTNLGHINVTLWREEDQDNYPSYSILVVSSFALSLWHEIKEAAQEYGVEIKRAYS